MIQLNDNNLCILSKNFDDMKKFIHYAGLDKISIQYVTFGGFIKGEKENENK